MRKLFLLSLLLFTPYLLADDYYFAVKGGVSLGSYEAGYNWLLIDELKRQSLNGGDNLKVMSGASAGAINTILSVLEYCGTNSTPLVDAFFNNRFREGWNVDIEQLLSPLIRKQTQERISDSDKKFAEQLREIDSDEGAIYFRDRGSLFSRAPFIEKINAIEDNLINGQFLESCNGLSITISVTRFVPEEISLGKAEEPIKISRFVFPLRVTVERGKLYFSNHYQVKNENREAVASNQGIPFFHHIYLPDDEDRKVPIFQVIKAALASSAFPVAFSPVELSYCKSEITCIRGEYENAFFSDGGLFDNAPIGAASEQLFQRAELSPEFNPESVKVVYIDPSNRRSDEIRHVEEENIPSEKFGIAAYINYFAGAMDVGMNQELYRAKVRLMSKKIKLHTSSRRYPLAGNYHFHFAAFYSEDFRIHDYLVGIYDAAYDLVRIRCSKQSGSLQNCIREELEELLLSVISIDETADEYVQYGFDFIHYLYADEFGICIQREHASQCHLENPSPADKTIENPFKMISLSLRRHHTRQNNPARVIEEEKEFSNFIDRLSVYNERAGGKLGKSTDEILASSSTWLAKKAGVLYERLLNNQRIAANENYGFDATIDTLLHVSAPTVDTILAHGQTGYWPLSPLPYTRIDASLFYGFDIGEYAQVFTLRGIRLPLMQRLSLEFPISYHHMSKSREYDHYFSGGPTMMYHFDNYGLSTLEIGYEISGKGKRYYDEDSDGISLGIGLLGEGVRIQWHHRNKRVNSSYSPTEIRAQDLIMFKVDLFKSLKTVFNLR